MSNPDVETTPAGRVPIDPASHRPDQSPPRLRSVKLRGEHLERLALVYVRQSSPQQVLEHRESRARQYALAGHAVALGWPAERVLVIDEDQGQSGRQAETRAGFQRLLAEVTMDHVGLVLALEMSRLARSSKDWHQLIELCAVFGTLLADQDGLYDAGDPNDRLLLGLKGTMSEMELHMMRNRLERGKLHKAERGELVLAVPVGYVKLPSGQVELEPDEQARDVVHLIFDQFDKLGTVWAVFHYLVDHGIRLGIRVHQGPRRGQLEWRRPCLPTLFGILRHPIYAGAYAYGRRPTDPRGKAAGRSRARKSLVPMHEWKVLRRDHLPGYISWERYINNQEHLKQNRSGPESRGPVRHGPTLLSGLLICGTCGRRLQVSYRKSHTPYYGCVRHLVQAPASPCHQGLVAQVIDDLVAQHVWRALEPAALELSLTACQDIEQEREHLARHHRQQVERTRYEAERAERQYQAVEPENRLVARTLEGRWEQALRAVRAAEEQSDRVLRERPPRLTAEERDLILSLASDIPALWDAPETTAADRQSIVRCLVDHVVVDVQDNTECVDVTIHWAGGFVSRHEVVRPVRSYDQLRDLDQLMQRILRLREAGCTSAEIAERLNAEGFRPPKRRGGFGREMVRQLLSRRGLGDERRDAAMLGPHEWWLSALADELEMPHERLREWICRGWMSARQTPVQGLWIAWADGAELARLRELRIRSRRGSTRYPPELTTPKRTTDA